MIYKYMTVVKKQNKKQSNTFQVEQCQIFILFRYTLHHALQYWSIHFSRISMRVVETVTLERKKIYPIKVIYLNQLHDLCLSAHMLAVDLLMS